MIPNSSEPRKTSCTTLPTPTAGCAKSRTCLDYRPDLLPPFLNNTEPLEPEDLALQLALITMEVASMRHKMAVMAQIFNELAKVVNPDLFALGQTDG